MSQPFIKNLLKITVVCMTAALFVGCSTANKKSSSNTYSEGSYTGGNSGVTTMGLGNDNGGQSIGGYGMSEAYRLKGGANQIYFFDFDQSGVNSKYIPSLNAQSSYMLSHKGSRMLLTGNTDERGSSEYNIALGNRRALAIENVLKSQGIPQNRLRVVSYGSEKPIAQGHDEKAWALNRNVQLIFQNKGN